MKQTLCFDLALYSQEALTQAVEAFRDAATLSVYRMEGYWEITMDSNESNLMALAGEFENYAIRCENRTGSA